MNAAAILLLAEKGLSAHDIAEVAAALEQKHDRTNAERQARHRDKKKSNGVIVTALSPSLPSLPLPQTPSPSLPSQPIETANAVLSADADEPADEITPEDVVERWNLTAAKCGLPKARLTPERRRKLKSRLKSTALDDWLLAFEAVERSPFLRGETGNWRGANIDFMLQPSSFTKLIEGTYDQ